ncbi:FGGY-family carbohydrate kinase [Enterocloster hominis (ex Hitch et al. 2024)]|uniref:FGGY-family carbohydrate kinase n=1 Tax=Enterocloster hominis (ex Hitch et al. 2024) TaxID=1917870 RepID=A0ABV1D7L6_9FIRM
MIQRFDELISNEVKVPWSIRNLLPEVLVDGTMMEDGALLLEPSGILLPRILFSPPEGDAGTGMVPTNAVAVRFGNVSAGTSIFLMAVLEKPLKQAYTEIDMVATPDGKPVAMIHCNNCTQDMNAWISLLCEFAKMMGAVQNLIKYI